MHVIPLHVHVNQIGTFVFCASGPNRICSFKVIRVMVPDDEAIIKKRNALKKSDTKSKRLTSPLVDKPTFAGLFGASESWTDSKSIQTLSDMVDRLEVKPIDSDGTYDGEFQAMRDISAVEVAQTEGIKYFPEWFMEFEAEPDHEPELDLSHENELLRKYQQQDASFGRLVSSENEDWSGEVYEKSTLKHVRNKAFKQFQKRVQRSPLQCLRYDLNGRPLFYASDALSAQLSSLGAPNCPHCGSRRRFELQLMPALLSVLPVAGCLTLSEGDASRSAEQKSVLLQSGMEWGTALIYSCSKDCSPNLGHDTVKDLDVLLKQPLTPILAEEFIAVQNE